MNENGSKKEAGVKLVEDFLDLDHLSADPSPFELGMLTRGSFTLTWPWGLIWNWRPANIGWPRIENFGAIIYTTVRSRSSSRADQVFSAGYFIALHISPASNINAVELAFRGWVGGNSH